MFLSTMMAPVVVLLLWITLTSYDAFAFAPRGGFTNTKRSSSSSGSALHLFQQPSAAATATSCRSKEGVLSLSSSSSADFSVDQNRHSASDWLYNIKSFPDSKVFREIRNPVLAVAGWSFAVSLVYKVFQSSSSGLLNAAASHMTIPGTAHSFLVSALGLLLVFRTNSAYQRFNEGRKIWENILSVSRNMSRMVQLYSNEVGPERSRRILNLVAAFPYLLRQHIRPGCLCTNKAAIPEEHRLLLVEHPHRHIVQETRHEGQEDMKKSNKERGSRDWSCWVDKRQLPWSLFMKSSLPQIARAENRPLFVCDRIASLFATIPYSDNFTSRERLALLGMVDKLTNAIGQCERIHQTAVPLNYARHSLRSLTLWLFTLPFALVKDLGLFTAPVNASIAWLFFGVYQIGYSIEDPFQGSLRLSILCDAIRRNVVGQNQDMRDSAYKLDGEDAIWNDAALSSIGQQQSSVSPEDEFSPLHIDTSLLSAQKLFNKNGTTWTEVGI